MPRRSWQSTWHVTIAVTAADLLWQSEQVSDLVAPDTEIAWCWPYRSPIPAVRPVAEWHVAHVALAVPPALTVSARPVAVCVVSL